MKSFTYTKKQLKKREAQPESYLKINLKGPGQPKQTIRVQSLYKDLFEMAAVYLTSIVHNHPFVDGNKRTGTHTAILFLYHNGYEIAEFHQTELAVLARKYVNRKIDKEGVTNFLANHAKLGDG